MHKFIAYISVAFGVVSFFALGLMLYAHSQAGGMAVLMFQLWTVLAAVAAMVFGGLSRLISHRRAIPHVLAAKMGVLIGALVIVILVAILAFAA